MTWERDEVLSAYYLVDGTLVYELRMSHTADRLPKRLILAWPHMLFQVVCRVAPFCAKSGTFVRVKA
jgi:hypothetical protein